MLVKGRGFENFPVGWLFTHLKSRDNTYQPQTRIRWNNSWAFPSVWRIWSEIESRKTRVLHISWCLSGTSSTAPFVAFHRSSVNKAIYICSKSCITDIICYIESSNISTGNFVVTSKWIQARKGKPNGEGQPKPSSFREVKYPTVNFRRKFLLFRKAR